MFRKLHWKLTILFFALFFTAFLVAGLYAGPKLDAFLAQKTEDNLRVNTQVSADAVQGYVEQGDSAALKGYVKSLGRKAGARITVVDPQGRVIADSEANPDRMENHAQRPEIKQALQGRTVTVSRSSTTLHTGMLYVASPIQVGQKSIAVIRLAVPQDDLKKSVVPLRWVVLVSIGVALVGATGMTFILSREFVKPIRHMTKVAERIGDGDFEQRVSGVRSTELDYLGRTINYMAKRLKTNITAVSNEKNKIKTIVTSLADGVVALDHRGRIMLVNQRAELMFGQWEAQLQGKYLLELTRHHDVEIAFQEVIDGVQEVTKEFQLFPGARTIVNLHVVPIIGQNNHIDGVVMVFRDVTELRTLEQIRTEFVANVSHELRTPLTSIKGFAETLLDGADSDPEVRRRFLNIIWEETQRLHRLIDDLLSLSKVENVVQVEEACVSFEGVLAKTVEVLKPHALLKEITLQLEVPPNLPEVGISEDLLGQVLINLLDNAIKYSGPGGRVTLAAEVQETGLQVRVSDNGLGIPAESLARIFERFYRVDKARSRQVGGTGLGLSIVKHILERQGQRIWVKSELGKGSTFGFTLPIV